MPIYDFKCQNCGDIREHIAGRDESIPCPVCGGGTVRMPALIANYTLDGVCGASTSPKGRGIISKEREKAKQRVWEMEKKQLDSLK